MATKSGWTVGYANKAALREMLGMPKLIRANFTQIRRVIETEGLHKLPYNDKKYLGNDLWELRLTGKKVISRALYLKWEGSRVIILRVFIKKKQHTERHHIKIALQRAKEFENAQRR